MLRPEMLKQSQDSVCSPLFRFGVVRAREVVRSLELASFTRQTRRILQRL